MIICFWNQILPSFFGCHKLGISMFSYIFIVFLKFCSFISLKKIFFEIIFAFCLASIQIIYIPILKIWWFFILIFHVFLISFCILMNSMTYSTSDTCFYHYILMSVSCWNLNFLFLRLFSMLIQVHKKKWAGWTRYFKTHFSKIFKCIAKQ